MVMIRATSSNSMFTVRPSDSLKCLRHFANMYNAKVNPAVRGVIPNPRSPEALMIEIFGVEIISGVYHGEEN